MDRRWACRRKVSSWHRQSANCLNGFKSGFARKRYIFGTFLATAALTTIIVAYGDRTNQIQPPIRLRGLSVALIQSSGLWFGLCDPCGWFCRRRLQLFLLGRPLQKSAENVPFSRESTLKRQTRLHPEWMALIGPSHHDFGAGDAMTRSIIILKTLGQNAVLMVVILTR